MPPPFLFLSHPIVFCYRLLRSCQRGYRAQQAKDAFTDEPTTGYLLPVSQRRKHEIEAKARVYLRLCHEEAQVNELEAPDFASPPLSSHSGIAFLRLKASLH